MSIRRQDMPRIYSPDFNIPETVTDEELMNLILPNNVIQKQKNKKQSTFMLEEQSRHDERRPSVKSDLIKIEQRAKECIRVVQDVRENAEVLLKAMDDL
jgi:hypothetical protein